MRFVSRYLSPIMVAASPSSVPASRASTPPAPPAPTITTPQAFLSALIASNFDFAKISAQVSPTQLMEFVQDPEVLAKLGHITSFSNICTNLRYAHYREIAMRQLVVAKGEDRLLQRGILFGEIFGLPPVMLIDGVLDRDRAGHRGTLAEERRRGAEHVAGNRP